MSSAADPAIGMVTPTLDANITPGNARGLLVGVAGDVEVVMADGTTGVIPALAAGVVHPIRVRRVVSAGTTASDIRIFY